MDPPPLDPFTIISWLIAGGALGGGAEYLRQIVYRRGALATNSDELSLWPALGLMLISAVIGLSGAIAIQFIFVLLQSFKDDNTTTNILFLFSISVAAGFGARHLLPQLTEGLKKKIEGFDQKVMKVDEKTKEMTNELHEARFTLHLTHALSPSATESERREAIEILTKRIPSDPMNRLNTILLGRLHRAQKNYQSAIDVLDNFLRRKEGKGERDKDYEDVSYNMACYYALLHAEAEDEARKEEYKNNALKSLARSFEKSDENKINARTDSDFDSLRNYEDFVTLIE